MASRLGNLADALSHSRLRGSAGPVVVRRTACRKGSAGRRNELHRSDWRAMSLTFIEAIVAYQL